MKRIVMLAAACAIALPAFAQNVATVNGKAIPQKSLDQFVKLLVTQGATDSPQLREQVKQEMINRQIFVQAAESNGIAKQADVQTEIELARQGILVRALMADYLAKHPVSDAKVTAEYEKIKKEQAGKMEYKVRHILVEDEKTANDLLTQLKGNKGKFDDLAKKNSKDPGSAERVATWVGLPDQLRAAFRSGRHAAEEGPTGRQARPDAVRLAHHPGRRHPPGAVPAAGSGAPADRGNAAPANPGRLPEGPAREGQDPVRIG